MDIQVLKDKILQLAIQGKLVEQDENDEPASMLVEKIKKEREKLVQEKKIRKEKLWRKITEEEIPFEIPKGWTVMRYGDIAQYRKGPFGSSITKSMFVPKSETTAKIYEQKNAIQKDINLGDYYITAEKFKELESFELQPGDIIVSCAGTIGETFIIPNNIERGIINQALMKITLSQYVDKRFYLMYFNYILNTQITNVSKGSAIKNIPPLKHLKNIVFPLPSLQEQKRIVEKVDQLFTLVDELAANKGDLLETINLTRNQVLQEAIQGKLVEQNKNDVPAIVLLEDIKKEKEKLTKRKKIRKEKPSPKISEEEQPFEIPKNWEWVRLREICYNLGQKKPDKSFTYIDVSSIDNKTGVLGDESNILTPEEAPSRARKLVKLGTVIYSTVRPYLLNIAIIDRDFEFEPIVSTAFAVMNTFNGVNNKFLFYYLRSNSFNNYVDSQMVGMAYPAINDSKLFKGLFPLPPLTEQKRIVEKVDTIMIMLDELENELTNNI